MTDKIIDRIKKMLALANDLAATEGERDNALRMAYATMAKYNIDMATVDAKGSSEPRIDFENQSFSWLWAKQVNGIVGKLFFCKVWISGTPVNASQCKFHFVGKESNAMTAAVMADWIVKSILKEGRKMYGQNTAPGTRNFAVGAMHALSARVDQIIAEQSKASEAAQPGTALVLASLYKTEMEANELMMPENLRHRKSSAKVNDYGAYSAGRDFGNSINLNKQVGGNKPQGQIK